MNRLPNLGGYTPADIENMGMDFLLRLALTQVGRSVPAEPPFSPHRGDRRGEVPSFVVQPSGCPYPLTLTPPDRSGDGASASQHEVPPLADSVSSLVNRTSRIVHRRRPRSK